MSSNASFAVLGFMNFGISVMALFKPENIELKPFIQLSWFRLLVHGLKVPVWPFIIFSVKLRVVSIHFCMPSFCVFIQFWKKSVGLVVPFVLAVVSPVAVVAVWFIRLLSKPFCFSSHSL